MVHNVAQLVAEEARNADVPHTSDDIREWSAFVMTTTVDGEKIPL